MLLVVPTGVVGAVFAMLLRDMPNDVYFKVGLITVIGLTAKNAILIIEVAKDLVAQGRSVHDAALEPRFFGRAGHHRKQLVVRVALGQVVERAPLHGLHPVGHGPVGGEQNDFGQRGGGLVAGEQVHAVAIGQLHVGEHHQHLVAVLAQGFEAAAGIRCLQHGVPLQL